MRVILLQPARWHVDGLRNFTGIAADLVDLGSAGTPLVILPELLGSDLERHVYEDAARGLARSLGAWVVAGSHHDHRGNGVVNSGIAVDPHGDVVATYEKANPYGVEVESGVRPGSGPTVFEIDGRRVGVMLCADFWFADSFDLVGQMDVIAVPAFSITQRRRPESARSLWTHMAVARAYEHTTFVAISDWAESARYGDRPSSGVAGLADPNPAEADGQYYSVLGDRRIEAFTVTFDLLRDLRANRSARGFVRRLD